MTTTAAIVHKMAVNVNESSYDEQGFIIYGGVTINDAAEGAFRKYIRDWGGDTLPNRFYLIANDGQGFYDIDQDGNPTLVS